MTMTRWVEGKIFLADINAEMATWIERKKEQRSGELVSQCLNRSKKEESDVLLRGDRVTLITNTRTANDDNVLLGAKGNYLLCGCCW